MIGRPEEFREAARRLRSARGSIEGDVHRLRAVSSGVLRRWESPAARSFESNEYRASLRSYEFVTRDLDDLARTLDDAARQLEDAILAVQRIESRVRWWFSVQPPPEDGSPPRWEQQYWRYRPGRLPVPGDSEWFEARRYLRGLGLGI